MIRESHIEQARSAALADLDSFTDWLSRDCIGVSRAEGEDLRGVALGLAPDHRLATAGVPDLLHLMLFGGRWDCYAARNELVSRYLHAARDRIAAGAEQLSRENAE